MHVEEAILKSLKHNLKTVLDLFLDFEEKEMTASL
jgi:hypothetical protein